MDEQKDTNARSRHRKRRRRNRRTVSVRLPVVKSIAPSDIGANNNKTDDLMENGIRIWFHGFWRGFSVTDNYITKLIQIPHIVVSDNNPDIVFINGNAGVPEQYKSVVTVQVINSEAGYRFNPREYDFCIGSLSKKIRRSKRNIYLPYYLDRCSEMGVSPDSVWNRTYSDSFLLERGFCSFIGTTENRIHREAFINELSKYKKVDAFTSGQYQRGKLPDDRGFRSKIGWLGQYKFNICFENSDRIGYITEKIIDPVYAKTLPIYFGNIRTVNKDFNIDDALIVKGSDFRDVVDRVIYLDQHDDDYLSLIRKPILKEGVLKEYSKRMTQVMHTLIGLKRKIDAEKYSTSI